MQSDVAHSEIVLVYFAYNIHHPIIIVGVSRISFYIIFILFSRLQYTDHWYFFTVVT